MSKLEFPPSEALYPAPVVLVSCVDENDLKANIITIAWCGVACSRPPLLTVSIRPSRYSHKLLSKAGDFVVNIPTKDLLEKADQCGIRSGKDIDKFAAGIVHEIAFLKGIIANDKGMPGQYRMRIEKHPKARLS